MKRAIFHNWQLKLVAGVLAIMVWITIQRATSMEEVTVFNVRVEPRVPTGWRVVEVEPPRVAVVIRGERVGVMTIPADHFLAQPRLEFPESGRKEIEVPPATVESPPKIKVREVHPARVTVRIEKTSPSSSQ